MKSLTRRNFNSLTAKGIGGAALLSSSPFACAMGGNQGKKKLGIALVGLGSYSTYQLAPAFICTHPTAHPASHPSCPLSSNHQPTSDIRVEKHT